MSDPLHIYRLSLLLKLLCSIPFLGWGIIAILADVNYHHAEIGGYIFLNFSALFVLLVATHLLTEEIEIDSHILVCRTVFFEKKVPISGVLEAKCAHIGKGNTCLRVRTAQRTFSMAYFFKNSDIESMADELMRFSRASE